MNIELLRKLDALTPKNLSTLIGNSNKTTDSLRINAILKAKSVILFDYYLGREEKEVKLKKGKISIDKLLNLSISKAFIGISQISQNAIFLLNSIHHDPQLFTNLIIESYKTSDYFYFIRIVVPSFFGYFSSNEHLDLAEKVYSMVIDKAPKNICIDALIPLLNSVGTHRFVEYALTSFFDDFRATLSATNPKEISRAAPVFAMLLLNCFRTAIPLLPPQILSIIRRLYTSKKNSSVFKDVIFIKFLWKQTTQWFDFLNIKVEPIAMLQIYMAVEKNKQELTEFYQQLQTAKSIYQVPSIYKSFNLQTMIFVISVSDLIIAAKLMDKFSILPSALSISEFTEINQSLYDNVISCQYYMEEEEAKENVDKIIFTKKYDLQKPPYDIQVIHENMRKMRSLESIYSGDQFNALLDLILAMDESKKEFKEVAIYEFYKRAIANSDIFELFIAQRCQIKEIEKWYELNCNNEVYLYTPLLERIIKGATSAETRKTLLNKMLNIIKNEIINKKLVMTNMNVEVSQLAQSNKNVLKMLDIKWNDVIETMPGTELTQKENIIVLSAVRAIKTIDSAPLAVSFDMLQKMMTSLSVSGNYKDNYKLFIQSFKMFDNPVFLSRFVLLNATVMNDYQYMKYFTQEEQENWFLLEKMTSQVMSFNSNLFAAFAQTQELIITQMKHVL